MRLLDRLGATGGLNARLHFAPPWRGAMSVLIDRPLAALRVSAAAAAECGTSPSCTNLHPRSSAQGRHQCRRCVTQSCLNLHHEGIAE
jgi:hypothetical protein